MLDESLFPTEAHLSIQQIDYGNNPIRITICSDQQRASCPGCGLSSDRVHLAYERFPKDLPNHSEESPALANADKNEVTESILTKAQERKATRAQVRQERFEKVHAVYKVTGSVRAVARNSRCPAEP